MAERALLGGRYELGPAIGSGGFATVFRARDRQANTDVAVKLVPPGLDASHLAERLRSEAAVLKQLSSRHLARVFEPHFSTRTSGSGLGLAICKRIVEGWGGSIALESTPGSGTAVTLTLAVAVRTDEITRT